MSIVKNITIGAITGALVSGVPTIALASLFTEAEYIDFPLHQDKCPGYEVTTENFHIDTIKEGENEVEKSSKKTLFLSKIEINNLSAVTFKTYTPYSERVIKGNTKIAREENHYEYYIDMPKEKIDNIINNFQNGKFEEISTNADFDINTYDIAEYLTEEELDNNIYYSADLTVNTVDYNKSKTITEEKDSFGYNACASGLILISATIGGCLGLITGTVEEEKEKRLVK